MAEGLQLTMGAEASCSDGVCGEVDRLIVNPETMVLTHIGVEPKHGQLAGRLVPIELVDTSTSGTNLLCTLADFENLGAAEEEHPQPPLPSLPFEKILTGSLDPQYEGMHDRFGFAVPTPPKPLTYDLLPAGAVEVRRDSQVVAKDGAIGQLQALVIEPGSHDVTHVLLQEGHHFGRKQVAIPIRAVNWFDEEGLGIQLKISKREVQGLPDLDNG